MELGHVCWVRCDGRPALLVIAFASPALQSAGSALIHHFRSRFPWRPDRSSASKYDSPPESEGIQYTRNNMIQHSSRPGRPAAQLRICSDSSKQRLAQFEANAPRVCTMICALLEAVLAQVLARLWNGSYRAPLHACFQLTCSILGVLAQYFCTMLSINEQAGDGRQADQTMRGTGVDPAPTGVSATLVVRVQLQ